MIYLEFLDGQGLGNQLWNYASLRSISKKLGLGYKVINPEKFKGKSFLDISYSEESSNRNSAKFEKYYESRKIFNEKLFFDSDLKTFASDFDKEVMNILPNTLIRGLFQSERYFFENNINEFFSLNYKTISKINSLNNTCLINIRGGEYKRFKNLILPKNYWLDAMKNMLSFKKNLKFYIITDDYKYASRLFPELEIIKGDVKQDFANLYSAKYLIVSNSSFSYFPISLGRKPDFIIAPANWSRFGNRQNRWLSPANYYKNWNYQDQNGEILKTKITDDNVEKTRQYYLTYNVLTTEKALSKKRFIKFIPKKLKKIIKELLSNLFPLYFG